MVIPADHDATAKALGAVGLSKMIITAGLNYRRTMLYLLKRKRFRDFVNFLYTKTLVPTGEGSGELAYYFIGGFLQRHPQLAWYPNSIEIEVTSRCNKRCVICEHTWWNEPSTDLTLPEFKHLVEQFNLRWVNLTGEGDAFLNRDYLEMIRYLKAKGTSVYLTDSFDLVSKDVALELVRLGVDGIYISMDGATKETYEGIKAGCSLDKTLRNIQGLLAVKRELGSPLPEICFRYIVNKRNVHEMPDFVKLVNTLGTRKDWGDGAKIHFSGLLDFPAVHDLYLETIPTEYIDAASKAVNDTPAVFVRPYKNPSINRCLAWMEPYFALVPHPMVLPCCSVMMSNARTKLAEYCFGNYTNEPMKDIWNHPYYMWFRETVTKKDAPVPMLCVGCRAYDTTERIQKFGVDRRKREDEAQK